MDDIIYPTKAIVVNVCSPDSVSSASGERDYCLPERTIGGVELNTSDDYIIIVCEVCDDDLVARRERYKNCIIIIIKNIIIIIIIVILLIIIIICVYAASLSYDEDDYDYGN
jgi:hypothetical protein